MNFDRNIARIIDHTILKPEAMRQEVMQICAEALRYEFASVCVNSFWVPAVAAALRGSNVRVCTVVGFPLGAASTAAKVCETAAAISDGAQEVDMVINVGALRGGETDVLETDIRSVVETSHARNVIVKVILETSLLTTDEKILVCRISKGAGADFVKTSTGFGKSGATAADVALMRATVGPDIGVKASGGIRTLEDLRSMVASGASRIGASASVKIVEATSS